jgi:predicted O-methyltransferase YrrM
LEAILSACEDTGFDMSCDTLTGALLGTLAASKPRGRFLEIGCGAGASTSWMLQSMDSASTLVTVDNDAQLVEIARAHLGEDPRVRFLIEDATETLRRLQGQFFDMVFADSWPGKFQELELALNLLAPGSLYVIDDLLPQPNWPDGHGDKVVALVRRLSTDSRLALTKLSWSTGLIVAARLED